MACPLLRKLNFKISFRTEITNIQVALGLNWSQCPLDNCGCIFATRSLLEVHYAVEHFVVLDHYMINIRGSPAGNALTVIYSIRAGMHNSSLSLIMIFTSKRLNLKIDLTTLHTHTDLLKPGANPILQFKPLAGVK